MTRLSFSAFKLFLILLFVAEGAAALEVAPGEFIVRYKRNRGTISSLSKTSLSHNMRLKKSWNGADMHLFKSGSALSKTSKRDQVKDDATMLKELREDPDVLFAEPNYIVRTQMAPFFPTNAPIRAPESWAEGKPVGDADIVTVAIIDSGLDINHEAFRNTGRLWTNQAEANGTPGVDDDGNGYIDDVHGYNFLDRNANLSDGSGHGTHVSGIALASTEDITQISASNASTNQRIEIMVVKFIDGDGVGRTSDAIDAIYYAIDNGAKVLSNSWGGTGFSSALMEAVAFSFVQNRLFVAAAGNSSSNNDITPIYPADYEVPNVISVGATDNGDNAAFFTNFGTESVDISAPGVNVLSAAVGGGYTLLSGTSMSTPFVSGAAALMVREAPQLSGYQLRRDILASADIVSQLANANAGSSRINFQSAVLESISNSSEATFNPEFVASFSSRDLASIGSSDGGAGCGRVKNIYKSQNSKMKNGTFKLSHAVMVFGFLVPFVLIGFIRSKLSYKRRHERYNVDFKGALFDADGSRVDVQVCTFSLGGAGVKISLEKDAFEGRENLILKFTTSKGELKEYACKAVSSHGNRLGLCFDQS